MAAPSVSWRGWRVWFRRCRMTLLLLTLGLIGVVLWFDYVGLPDFVQQRLVATLRGRGVELGFTRLRWRPVRGLLAENVRFGPAAVPGGPAFSVQEVQVRLHYPALWHRRLQIDGLVLRDGKFTWQISETNEPPRVLVLDHIQTDLRFQTNDTWSLDDFQARLAGANLALSGDISHASAVRQWEFFRGNPSAGRARWQARLRKFSDTLDQIHFQGAPDLRLLVNGDARDLRSFVVQLAVRAPDAATPWGRVQQGFLTVKLYPARADRLPRATVRLATGAANTPWGSLQDLQFQAEGSLSSNAPAVDASAAWWTNLQPCRVSWSARVRQWQSEELKADSAECGGFWAPPELAVTNLLAKLGGGGLEARMRLNVNTRELTFTNGSCFDVGTLSGLLTEKTQHWLAQFSWPQPPSWRATGALILPAWTNRRPDWRGEVQPTLRLAGEFAFAHGAFLNMPVAAAGGHFSYSNLVWRLPDLVVSPAQGRLNISGVEDDHTKDFQWHVLGGVDPNMIRPLLGTAKATRALDIFTTAAPVQIDVEVRGRLYEYERLGVTGRVAVTNFAIRGQAADCFESAVQYTNRLLDLFHPRVQRGAQTMTADRVTLDFNARRIYFTNGFSTADPLAVARAIGPKTGVIMEPYHFLRAPTARVNGYAPLRDVREPKDADADLRFEVEPVPFECLKLRVPDVSGQVRWLGATLVLTNVSATFYGGSAEGFANFDFQPEHGADFQFTVAVTNVDLRPLSADVAVHTNHLEGFLSGNFTVTRANTKDRWTWNGFGRAGLHDGLLWDIPVFGIVSPVLNAISPGLGNSRATEASAKFAVSNGVFATDSLEIRSTMTRLQYAGTLDMAGHVDARVNAELLRNTPVVGPLISTALWPVSKMFEYKISGPLEKPKSEPLYIPDLIPKVLLLPLHPIRSLEEMFNGAPATNAPPQK